MKEKFVKEFKSIVNDKISSESFDSLDIISSWNITRSFTGSVNLNIHFKYQPPKSSLKVERDICMYIIEDKDTEKFTTLVVNEPLTSNNTLFFTTSDTPFKVLEYLPNIIKSTAELIKAKHEEMVTEVGKVQSKKVYNHLKK